MRTLQLEMARRAILRVCPILLGTEHGGGRRPRSFGHGRTQTDFKAEEPQVLSARENFPCRDSSLAGDGESVSMTGCYHNCRPHLSVALGMARQKWDNFNTFVHENAPPERSKRRASDCGDV